MQEAADEQRFEEAARYRNRLVAVRHLLERQAADRPAEGNVDVLGLAVEGDRAAVQIFPLRGGRMVDRYAFHLESVAGQDAAALVEAFCLEYYGAAPAIPPLIVVPRAARRAWSAVADVPERAARRSRRAARAGARREAPPAGAGDARTPGWRSRPRLAPRESGAPAPDRGARGAARGAQPREPADQDRVLRRLQPAGGLAGRLDGRLSRRVAAQGALPQVRAAHARRAERRRRR